MYRLNSIFIKNPVYFTEEVDKLFPKFIWKYKGLRIAKITLKNKNVGVLTFLYYRFYYKAAKIECHARGEKKPINLKVNVTEFIVFYVQVFVKGSKEFNDGKKINPISKCY